MITKTIPTILLLALIATAIAQGGPAQATPFEGRNTGYADNYYHTFAYIELTQNYRDASNWSRSNNFNPTDIDTVMYDPCCADVDVRDKHLGSRASYGSSHCESYVATRVCDHAHVTFNLDLRPGSRRSLACHEFAHTVGFGPDFSGSGASCTDTNGWSEHFTDHDRRDHINVRY